MTREEAIKIIDCYDIGFYDLSGEKIPADKLADAFDMAIEALSKPIVDITQRDLCADISCTDCPFMKETCKLMDYVAYADRPHGEWICKGDYAECSECGGSSGTQFDGVEPIPRITAFCPHCGVDMRKENKQL